MEQTKSTTSIPSKDVIEPEVILPTGKKVAVVGDADKSNLLMKTMAEWCTKKGITLDSLIDGSAGKDDMEAASDIFQQFMPKRAPKKEYKCGLPGCNVMSTRDYCCSDHCKEHRKIIKERKS